MPTVDEDDVDESEELRVVRVRRRREALRAGMSTAEARMFAESDIDIEKLRHAVRRGCPRDLIAKIVL